MAEREIRTLKKIIAGLCTYHPKLPSSYWYYLLPQATITLNLLISSRRNPSLSVHAAVFGQFNFNSTPLASPGTKAIIHDKTRKSFGARGCEGWYIDPAMKYYRCYRYINSSSSKPVNTDTVYFLPHNIPFPLVTPDNDFCQTAEDILNILQNSKSKIPTLIFSNPTTIAFVCLAQILKRATRQSLITPDLDNTPRWWYPTITLYPLLGCPLT